MRQAIWLLIPLLAACGTAPGGRDEASQPAPRADSRSQVQTQQLTGLYQGTGESGQKSRMCMVSGTSGAAAFGLVSETMSGTCSGTGQAARTGNGLRLTMAGDEQCVIDARIDGTSVTFPAAVAAGCAYYCAPGATLAGVGFDKTGGTLEDSMRASDLAGDPLCEQS